jgi:trehalose 6-phosphate synthase/phosphatase
MPLYDAFATLFSVSLFHPKPQIMKYSSRLFIVSNRLPITVRSGDNGEPEIRTSAGGLITAMDSYLQGGNTGFTEAFWVGVPGCNPTVWEEASRKMTPSQYTYLPVLLYNEQYDHYYNGFSNSVIWPLFHYFPSYAEYKSEYFDHYLLANEHFVKCCCVMHGPAIPSGYTIITCCPWHK